MPSPVKNKAYKKAQQESKRQLPALDPQPGFVIAEQRSRATKFCCCSCGKLYSAPNDNFVKSSSPLFYGWDGYVPMCKSCADLYLQKKVLPAFDGDERKAMERMCSLFDWYWDDTIFAQAQKARDENVLRGGKNNLISCYSMKRQMRHNMLKGQTYLDSAQQYFIEGKETLQRLQEAETAAEEAAAEIQARVEAGELTIHQDASDDNEICAEPDPETIVPEEDVYFFGPGYTVDQYKYLREQYEDWCERYDTQTKAQEEIFKSLCRRNQDTAPYIANIELDGGDIVWTITSAETARVGDGECELTYTVGDSIAKSQIWTITVCESLTGQEPVDPPEPAKNWVDVVIKSASDAKQSATESAESATESAESAVNAQKSAENAADSANEAHKSREAIENMEASAVSLPPNSKATVEKDLVDGKVKRTFGIPRGESDIVWLNTVSYSRIAETFDEIVAAYKAGKSIWVRDTHSFSGGVLTAPEFIAAPAYDGTNIIGMIIVCGGSAYSSSEILGSADGIMNVTYYISAFPEKVTFTMLVNRCAEIGDGYTPNESQLSGYPGDSTSASPVDHIHPAPFPDWTSSIGKALFVGNINTAPSAAFEWRDVPNGDFTSKVGDLLRVAEVDSNNKPTKWTTDSIANAKGVNF